MARSLGRVPTKQIKPKNIRLSSLIAEQITDWIMNGDLALGQRINEVEISEKLGVSRIPVREAMRALEQAGLVVSTPYYGCRVRSLTNQNLKEIYLLRQKLESMAGYYAAINAGTDEIEELEAMQGELAEIVDSGEVSGKVLYEMNRDFHHLMYTCAKMPKLLELIENLWSNIASYRLLRANKNIYPDVMYREHKRYMDALKKRDAQGLSDLLYATLQAHYEELDKEELEKTGLGLQNN